MAVTYEPIATTTLGTAGSITFSSIPSTYTDLVLVWNGVLATSSSAVRIELNGTTTGYSTTQLRGDGAAASSGTFTALAYGLVSVSQNNTNIGFGRIHFFSYAGSTNKTFLSEAAEDRNGSGNVSRHVNLWSNTAAITQIKLFAAQNWAIGTTATLYGIKAA